MPEKLIEKKKNKSKKGIGKVSKVGRTNGTATPKQKKFIKKFLEENNIELPTECTNRDASGRFIPGNDSSCVPKYITSVKIRKHRDIIMDNLTAILAVMIDEAVDKRNMPVAMWLAARIIPQMNSSTFMNAKKTVDKPATLSAIQDEGSEIIHSSFTGEISFEEGREAMALLKDQKAFIESKEVERFLAMREENSDRLLK